MAAVFFSYCHVDESLRDRLETHLAMLKREGVIEAWHDRRVVAGSPLDPAIWAEVERADLFLCLVSADFLASEYCYSTEMARALERQKAGQAHVIPIILRDCEWKRSPLGKLLAVPRDGKPVVKFAHEDEAFLQVVEAIRGYLASRAPTIPGRGPTTSSAMVTQSAEGPKTFSSMSLSSSSRSSNLRLRKTFTDADKHIFQEEGFAFIARYFEGSLTELQARNPGLQASFKRINANNFTAHVFVDGRLRAQCRVFLGGMMSGGIAYSGQAESMGNSFNECVMVKADDQSLHFESMGMARIHGRGDRDQALSQEGAAELYWSMFMEPLQR